MKRTTYIALGVVLSASLIGFVVFKQFTAQKTLTTTIKPCTTDVMMCPDGTTIARRGPDCKFGVCKQELPSYLQEQPVTQQEAGKPSQTPPSKTTTTQGEASKQAPTTTNLFTKITTAAINLFTQASNNAEGTVASGIQETTAPKSTSPTNNQATAASTPILDEVRYLVIRNNTLVDQNNKTIYTFPSSFSSGTGGSMESHFVNAVAVNQVAPIIGAIPIDGQTGKYYLSENSFGQSGSCQFSNKIYILDTIANTKTLFYEENSSTLGVHDPRACTSEIYLLATEGEKLILKYHTIGTNMVCDSTWSEPEKTWFLDVTKTAKGTRIYPISPQRYAQAENYEASCREQLTHATTTP